MRKVIRLKENDLVYIIKNILKEEVENQLSEPIVTDAELQQAAENGDIPQKITQNLSSDKKNKLINLVKTELAPQIDEFCRSGKSDKEIGKNVKQFLFRKISEYRQKIIDSIRQKQNQRVNEQVNLIVVGIIILLAFVPLMILLVRIFSGGDRCGKWEKWKQRNFSGFK